MWPKGNAELPSSDNENNNNENEPKTGWKEKLQELRRDVRMRIRNGVNITNQRLEQLETKLDPTRQVVRQRYEQISDSYMKVKETTVYALDAYKRRDQAAALFVVGIAGLSGTAFLMYRRRWTPASAIAAASGGCLFASVYGLDLK